MNNWFERCLDYSLMEQESKLLGNQKAGEFRHPNFYREIPYCFQLFHLASQRSKQLADLAWIAFTGK